MDDVNEVGKGGTLTVRPTIDVTSTKGSVTLAMLPLVPGETLTVALNDTDCTVAEPVTVRFSSPLVFTVALPATFLIVPTTESVPSFDGAVTVALPPPLVQLD